MKNNITSFSQFLSLCLTASLSSLMFISAAPSVFNILCSALALSVNFIVFIIYKGQLKGILTLLAFLYLTFYCILITVKFSDYMKTALSYGPACLILTVLLCFTFFCTAKGLEAVYRAASIIVVFLLAGIVYMFVCTFTDLKINLSFELPAELVSSVILLLPSFLYIVYYDNIKDYKGSYYLVYSVTAVLITVYFLLTASGINSVYPIQYLPAKAKIGVFKGSDCILLSILTLSCMFSLTSTSVGILKSYKHKYIKNALYLFFVLIISVFLSVFKLLNVIENYVFIPVTIVLLMVIILLSVIKQKNYV